MQKAEFSIPLMGTSGIVPEAVLPHPASDMFASLTFAPRMIIVRCCLQRRGTRSSSGIKKKFYETTDTKMKRFEERTDDAAYITGQTINVDGGLIMS